MNYIIMNRTIGSMLLVVLWIVCSFDVTTAFSLDPSRMPPPPPPSSPSSPSNNAGGTEMDGINKPPERPRQDRSLPGTAKITPYRVPPMDTKMINDQDYRKSTPYFNQFFGKTLVDPDMDGDKLLMPMPMYPADIHFDRIEGMKTVRNYRIPYGCERVQYMLSTPTGRPLKATVELWIGPIRKVHTLEIKSERAPVRATLKFKQGVEVITIKSDTNGAYPISACVVIPTPERSAELNANTELLWKISPKTKIQGGLIQGGKTKTVGAIRNFHIPSGAIAAQVIVWARDVGKKSFKLRIEILQGPNNIKQTYFLQCGGGSQPYHTIYELSNPSLPDGYDAGTTVIRMINQKFLEDGLVQVVVLPIFPPGSGLSGDVVVY